MTDSELEEFLGITRCSVADRAKVMASITLEKRALYERMSQVEFETGLYLAGIGPKPAGVLIDTVRSTNRRRGWK